MEWVEVEAHLECHPTLSKINNRGSQTILDKSLNFLMPPEGPFPQNPNNSKWKNSNYKLIMTLDNLNIAEVVEINSSSSTIISSSSISSTTRVMNNPHSIAISLVAHKVDNLALLDQWIQDNNSSSSNNRCPLLRLLLLII
eukprot:CAMPEP_0114582324 /NCGR_PEP_ID=MMETSP0125-20121206/6341_1 /TAXON_ID=485358 ORGANISM="Aristerostoma sp., Strain ATCC 50986" /NCGR_SAMPLE_ID=MMETSP0125 /ASSEMBLY_ACC=CAM_ASM_000245 /LENGTH=140 /DNA_ID=CAMNT_0001775235 /DNA_START=302 /DNA_END=724 /DNA_ORIENTATION=-